MPDRALLWQRLQKELVQMYVSKLPLNHLQPAVSEDVGRDKALKNDLNLVIDKTRDFLSNLDKDRNEFCKPQASRIPREIQEVGAGGSSSAAAKRKSDMTDEELTKKGNFKLFSPDKFKSSN